MMALDLEALNRPVSDDGPCGPDLSADPHINVGGPTEFAQAIEDKIRSASSAAA